MPKEFKKPFNKEEVLTWYKSLKETLKQVNIDLDNPKDLFRIKVMNFKPSADISDQGNHMHDIGERNYAFIPKKFNENGEVTGYIEEAPIPEIASAKEQMELQQDLYNSNLALLNHITAIANLKDAYKQHKSQKEIQSLISEIGKTEQLRYQKFNAFREKYCDHYGEYIKWMLGKQKPFNEVEDYAQIEELYEKSITGNLFVNSPEKSIGSYVQLVVGDNGKATFAEKQKEDHMEVSVNSLISVIKDLRKNYVPQNDSNNDLYEVVGGVLQKYEKENGRIGGDGELFPKFKEKKPAKVPAPTRWSWFKRIISFGIVKTDFKKYDEYKQKDAEYELHKKEHIEKNEMQYNDILKFIEKNKESLGIQFTTGIKNAAMVEDSKVVISDIEQFTRKIDPSKGLFEDTFFATRDKMEYILMNQIAKAPGTVNPDGSFNKEKMAEFWKGNKRDIIAPEHQEQLNKVITKMMNSKAEYDKQFGAEDINKEIVSKGKNLDVADIMEKKNSVREEELKEIDPSKKVGIDFAL